MLENALKCNDDNVSKLLKVFDIVRIIGFEMTVPENLDELLRNGQPIDFAILHCPAEAKTVVTDCDGNSYTSAVLRALITSGVLTSNYICINRNGGRTCKRDGKGCVKLEDYRKDLINVEHKVFDAIAYCVNVFSNIRVLITNKTEITYAERVMKKFKKVTHFSRIGSLSAMIDFLKDLSFNTSSITKVALKTVVEIPVQRLLFSRSSSKEEKLENLKERIRSVEQEAMVVFNQNLEFEKEFEKIKEIMLTHRLGSFGFSTAESSKGGTKSMEAQGITLAATLNLPDDIIDAIGADRMGRFYGFFQQAVFLSPDESSKGGLLGGPISMEARGKTLANTLKLPDHIIDEIGANRMGSFYGLYSQAVFISPDASSTGGTKSMEAQGITLAATLKLPDYIIDEIGANRMGSFYGFFQQAVFLSPDASSRGGSKGLGKGAKIVQFRLDENNEEVGVITWTNNARERLCKVWGIAYNTEISDLGKALFKSLKTTRYDFRQVDKSVDLSTLPVFQEDINSEQFEKMFGDDFKSMNQTPKSGPKTDTTAGGRFQKVRDELDPKKLSEKKKESRKAKRKSGEDQSSKEKRTKGTGSDK